MSNATLTATEPTESRRVLSAFTLRPAVGVALTVAFVACGNGVTDDPLTGDWSNSDCFGQATAPPDIESCTTSLTFASSLDFTLRIEWISRAATAVHPGCTTTWVLKGQQWSAEHDTDTLTLTGTSKATVARDHCVNAVDNLDATPTGEISVPSGKSGYTLSGENLAISTGALAGDYAR